MNFICSMVFDIFALIQWRFRCVEFIELILSSCLYRLPFQMEFSELFVRIFGCKTEKNGCELEKTSITFGQLTRLSCIWLMYSLFVKCVRLNGWLALSTSATIKTVQQQQQQQQYEIIYRLASKDTPWRDAIIYFIGCLYVRLHSNANGV